MNEYTERSITIMDPSYRILTTSSDLKNSIYKIEEIARTCYQSWDKNPYLYEEKTKSFVKMLISRNHMAMLEHSTLSVKFIVDRGVSHELVRHRMASFAQESTRYCNYSNDKFGGSINVIKPVNIDYNSASFDIWKKAMHEAAAAYFKLLDYGLSPQDARSVLPTCLKTEIIVTANFREWRHILELRCDKAAHPDMRYIMNKLKNELNQILPEVFG